MNKRLVRFCIRELKRDLYRWARSPYLKTKSQKIEAMERELIFYQGYACAMMVNDDITHKQYEVLNNMMRAIYHDVRDNVKQLNKLC